MNLSRRMLSNTLRRMYKAIEVKECGGPEVLKLVEKPLPKLERNQVLIRVKAAGVNPVDTYIRTGGQGYSPTLPYTPGIDTAGLVEDVGPDVKKFQKGDRVYTVNAPFSTGVCSGGYAEYSLMDCDYVHRLHEKTSFQQGASIGIPYYTAYRALFVRAQAKSGDIVLVHGASGGVGLAACEFARNRGLQVLGTASTAAGVEAVTKSGAHKVFNHREEGYEMKILEASNGGVDIILEMLANVNLQKDLEMVARNGRVVVIGSRGPIEINPRLTMTKESCIMGVKSVGATKEQLHQVESALYVGMEQGWINPVVHKEYPLDRACDAHHDIIHSAGAKGNLVLIP